MTKSQPYFTVDELAERWEMTRDGVASLGAEGLLKFGVFLSGLLPVEVGSFECAPGSKLPEFQVESSGLWQGFIPVTPSTVAAIWLNGATSRIHIPNTDCGKVVISRPQDYIPFDENDKGGRLLVDLAEVERYESKKAAASGTPDNNQPSQVRRGAREPATTKRMAEAFPHPKGTKLENWKRTLSDPPAWLKDARLYPGRPGVTALWDPAMFALCMVSAGHISKQAADNIIRREFSHFLDEWEERATYL